MRILIINVHDGRILPGTPESAANPDYQTISEADAQSIYDGRTTAMEWLAAHSGIQASEALPPDVALSVKEAAEKDVMWKGRIPAFRDQKGRTWADRGWLMKQRFDALNDISVQAGGRKFNRSEGKTALVDHIMALLAWIPPDDTPPPPTPADDAQQEEAQ